MNNMVDNQPLSQFMIQEHGKIIELLNDLKNNSKASNAKDYLKKLKTKQEIHVHAEEKAIMILANEQKDLRTVIITILKQHDELRGLMKKLEKYIYSDYTNYQISFRAFHELMNNHIILENKKFYPVLDKNLSENQKKLILQKFKEIIIGNI